MHKLNFFLEPRYFLVDGFWIHDLNDIENSKEEFKNYICCTSETVSTGLYKDSDVFLFNTTTASILKYTKVTDEDFVITKVQTYLPTEKEILLNKIKEF